jgi:hypothetical protein
LLSSRAIVGGIEVTNRGNLVSLVSKSIADVVSAQT